MRWTERLRLLAGRLHARLEERPCIYLWSKDRLRMYVVEPLLSTGATDYRVDIDVHTEKGYTTVALIDEADLEAAIELLQRAKACLTRVREE